MVNNFRATATHVARGVTKQLTASHRAKEKMEQDGIKATKAKNQAKRWSKGIHQRQRQRQRNEQL